MRVGVSFLRLAPPACSIMRSQTKSSGPVHAPLRDPQLTCNAAAQRVLAHLGLGLLSLRLVLGLRHWGALPALAATSLHVCASAGKQTARQSAKQVCTSCTACSGQTLPTSLAADDAASTQTHLCMYVAIAAHLGLGLLGLKLSCWAVLPALAANSLCLRKGSKTSKAAVNKV